MSIQKKKKKIDSYETKRKKESKGLEVKLFEYKFRAQSVKDKVWGAGVAIIESVETLSRNSPLPGRGKSDESRILSGLYRDNSGIHIFLPAVSFALVNSTFGGEDIMKGTPKAFRIRANDFFLSGC